MVGASGSHTDSNEIAGVDCHFTDSSTVDIVGTADDVKFLFIKNTGTSDTSGTTTTNSVYFTMDDGTAVYNTEDAIEIPAGEAWMGIVNNLVSDFIIISGAADASAVAATVNSSTSVKCTVVAVIADAGH